MAKQSSVNLDITNNADGFSISGGVTGRTLGISGGDVTLVGSGNATLTFPTTSTTVAGLGITQSFTAFQTFSVGASTNDAIYAYEGVYGMGLIVARTPTGTASRTGAIRLGNATTSPSSNTFLHNSAGTFTIYNGLGTTGTNLFSLTTAAANINVPINGATFSSGQGRIHIEKAAYAGSDSAIVRLVGADVSINTYNSDIRANSDATANTIHTLPATTGVLLNTTSSYVSGVSGATGNIGLVAGTNVTIAQSGKTFTISSSGGGSTNVVTSLNGYTGALGLSAGESVTINYSGTTFSIEVTLINGGDY